MIEPPLSEKQRIARLLGQMQAKLDAAEARGHEPVAVIGIGCRMPGGAADADAFWSMLEAGTDAVTDVPPERWDAEAWYDPDPDAPGKMNTKRGGFLRDVDLFDAEFFGISPREAISMDPQQRLVLEVAWRALEHAGKSPAALSGSRTGVYLGVCTSDYARLGDASGSLGALDTYSGTGGANGVAAGRLSYTLGLTGPSLVVDTACSSSLVAAHLAVQALRAGECDLALAGGVNLVLLPDGTVTLSRLHMMAPDGHCKAFDAAADGFVRGEGCGIVVLRRLADALADGDRVLAVIRGSAVNQDGRSAGLTAPSGLAQQAVVRAALADARVDPADIAYVEAHGTGTALGDPVEINALAAALGPTRERALLVGSVKTNIGHLEAAAGIAGLIKAIESVRRGRVAPSLHFRHINPHIRTGDFAVAIPTTVSDWPAGAPRLAGVSAFGFSGTNAHMVIEAAPPAVAREVLPSRGAEVLPLSARSAAALAQMQHEVAESPALASWADACYTAGAGRSAFAHRLAVVAPDGDAAREKLRTARGRVAGTPRIAFLFSGQGAQASGMGRHLYATEPVFRATLDRCAAVLDPLLGRPLTTLMFEGGADLDRTAFAQPALLAFELAMVDLLRDWGVEPEALLGHSLGEYAAAAVAQALTFEEALVLVATRGRLMQALPAGGAMAAVLCGRAQVESLLAADARLALAADNGPAVVTISGPVAAIEEACATLEARGIGTRRLAVSHAFHSALMDPALDAIEAAAAAIDWKPPRIPLVGNVEAKPLGRPDAAYWRRHTRAPVAFADGVRQLAAMGCDTFIEVGPHPVLLGPGRACIAGGEWIAAARHGHEAAPMEALARLFECGAGVRWDRVHAGRGRVPLSFPGHPMQRQSYWRRAGAEGGALAPAHPFLAQRIDLPEGRTAFRATLPDAAVPWLDEHRVGGVAIVPAAALLEAAASAAARCGRPAVLSAIAFDAALALDAAREVTIEVDATTVVVQSRPAQGGGAWTRHLRASLGGAQPKHVVVTPAEAPEAVDPATLHDWMRAGGIEHGAVFRRFASAARGEGVALARLVPLAPGPHLVHPALLDAALQGLAVAAFGAGAGRMRIPVAMESFSLEATVAPADDAFVHVRVHGDGASSVADLRLCNGDGRTLALVTGLRLGEAGVHAPWQEWLLERTWRAKPLPSTCEELALRAGASTREADTVRALSAMAGLGEAMDAAGAAYAARALQRLAPEAVAARHHALYERLPKLAAGVAAQDDPEERIAELARRYPGSATEIGLLQRCGSHLEAVLAGREDPLPLLFPGDGGASVYRDSPVSRALNRCVEDAVLAALPAQGELRILEAGAGTGGTTEGLLARLPAERVAEYAYTDISLTLLAAAGKRHAGKPWLVTRRLDIDRDPEAQGFVAGTYDVVLAANVVHAGADLVASLEGLARLLAPHGVLVLLEGAGAQGWIDLAFGLTEGWWRFADRERRPDYPLPERDGWLLALRDAGLEATIVEAKVADVLDRQAILVARRAPAKRWLVAGGDDALTVALADALQATRVAPLAPLPAGDWDGCVGTAALAMAPAPESVDALMQDQRTAIEATRQLALACSERGIPLALATSGPHAARATQATIWGLGRAIAAELPDLGLRLVDVDEALPLAEAAQRLAAELRARDGEDQVALAPEGRRVARLARCEAAPAVPAKLDPDAAYLVTGGFGGLGLHAAGWMAARGARCIVLMGRSPPSPDAEKTIALLEARGLTVHRRLGDVSREDDVRAALAASGRRVAGIVHAAGTLDDGVLAQLDWPRMERVLRAKVAGAWLLDRLAREADFFLLYSSAVVLVGSRGQANHVAANAFLDAIAAQRRRDGRAATSLAWGAWSGIGSATDAELRQRMQSSGMDPIVPDEAVHVLDWALTAAPACVGVLPVRWPAFARALVGEVPPVLRDLVPASAAQVDTKAAAAAASAPQHPAPSAPARMLDLVLAHAAEVLAAPGPQALDPAASLFERGLDSLMAVELRNRLQAALGRALPSTLLFDHPSPAALAAFLGDAPGAARHELPRGAAEEPIAIIGMDCRLPGGASDPQRFWELLCAGFDAVGPLPESRAGTRANDGRIRIGAFLDRVDLFDAAFFRIAPREAASMDPQQRLLLETAWHALERAGKAPDSLAGSATGVFVGVCNYDYPQLVSAAGRVDAWSATGGAPSIVAGRLAYTLGLEGPAMVVDTACSSSLVTVHLACRSLLAGECTMALAGGVNLILADSATDALSELQMLAPDGRCKAFDSRADGFVRGEGCGVIVLKRLSDAMADGDPVLAVIRGSHVNQDGRSPSLTAPSGRAQEAVIRQAVARAGVQPAEVGYVETHGTGTQLGDPIEINALKAVFGETHGARAPLVIGALKSNLGHLEAAAGIAGLIKATLAIAHARIPPNLHFAQLNPHIALDGLAAVFPSTVIEWPGAGPRVAGVSSFGFSGTNAHVVLQEAPAREAPVADPAASGPQLLAVSGATPEAARHLANAIADRLSRAEPPPLRDLAYSLIAGRAQLGWRIAIVAASAREAAARLRAAEPRPAPLQPAQTEMLLLPGAVEAAGESLPAMAAAFLDGARLSPQALHEAGARLVADLPVYPFDRQRHWIEPAAARPAIESTGHSPGAHPLLGARIPGPGTTRRYQSLLSIERLPWLADHGVAGVATLPAAAMLEVMAATAPQDGACALEDVEFHALLALAEPVQLHTECDRERIDLHAAPAGTDDWNAIASAVRADAPAAFADPPSLAALRERLKDERGVAEFYAAFAGASALAYGPAFRAVAALYAGKGEALARLALPAGLDASGMRLHPALLDGAFQSVGAAAEGLLPAGAAFLPAGLARFSWTGVAAAGDLWAWTRARLRDDGALVADIDLLREDGRLVARAESLRLQPQRRESGRRAFLHELAWRPASAGRDLPASWHLVAGGEDEALLVGDLARRLVARGKTLVAQEEADAVLVALAADDSDVANACAGLLDAVQALLRRDDAPQLWVVTRGEAIPGEDGAPLASAAGAAAWGLVASLRLEHPELSATVIDIPRDSTDAALLEKALAHHGHALSAGAAGIRERHVVPLAPGNCGGRFALHRPASGRIADLAFVPCAARAPGPGEVAIAVAATGLNFRDVMNVLGAYPGAAGELGGECAGYVTALGEGVEGLRVGQAVMAVAAGCHASHVLAPASLVLPIPDGWTLEQAGSSPTAYLTAAWALRGPGAIAAGNRVLVHAGTGGLGLAAIAIARAARAEVLATAGSEEKRAWLRAQGIACVSDSRSRAFVGAVLTHTGGRGVDIVVNSLSGELIAGGFEVLRDGGRFLEVGKAGIWSDEQARAHRPKVAYHRIALDRQIVEAPATVGGLWRGLVDEFERGVLPPLPATPFALEDAASAYRHMQQARHIGRVVLTRRFLRPEAAYLVTGGTGALGAATARWLLERGAGRVVLAARSLPDVQGDDEVSRLLVLHPQVSVAQADVSRRDEVERLLAGIGMPLAGVIHAAGALDDGVFTQLSRERLHAVFAAKVLGAQHLDALTRATPPDFFVLYSSAAGILGSAGQANYAAANAALDAVAHARRAAGCHALSLDWGAWSGGGLAARRGAPAMAPEHALAALEALLRAGATQALVLPEPIAAVADASREPSAQRANAGLAQALAALPASEQRRMLAGVVRREVATILSLPEATLHAQRPLNEYGLDSLMAVELRNALAALAQVRLPSSLLFDYPSIDALSGFLAQKLGIAATSGIDTPPVQAQASPPGDGPELDEDELAAALRKELERAGY